MLLFPGLKCEYAVRGEIVTLAQLIYLLPWYIGYSSVESDASLGHEVQIVHIINN